MALATNIVSRRGTYYVRVAMPVDLQVDGGPKEVWRSLRTKDRRDAKSLAAGVVGGLLAEWDGLRRRREPDGVAIQQAVSDFYKRELEIDRLDRLALPTSAQIDSAEAVLRDNIASSNVVSLDLLTRQLAHLGDVAAFTSLRDRAKSGRSNRAALLAELRRHLGSGETALIQWAADEIANDQNLTFDPNGQVYRDLCQRLMRAWIQALERSVERDGGNFSGTPGDTIVLPPTGHLSVVAAPGESVAELYEQFAAENPGGVTPDTQNQSRKIIELFVDSVSAGAIIPH